MAPAHRRRKTKLGLSRTCFHLLPGLSASHGDHVEGGPWVCWVSAAWNKLCTHTQQRSDLCISIGVSGTACLWCGSRKEKYLEPDQSRDKQSLPRSEYPESALRWLLYVWHSQMELGHGVGWSFPPNAQRTCSSTYQPAWDPVLFSLLPCFLLLSDVFFTRKLNF